jgi:hypothetical protein
MALLSAHTLFHMQNEYSAVSSFSNQHQQRSSGNIKKTLIGGWCSSGEILQRVTAHNLPEYVPCTSAKTTYLRTRTFVHLLQTLGQKKEPLYSEFNIGLYVASCFNKFHTQEVLKR